VVYLFANQLEELFLVEHIESGNTSFHRTPDDSLVASAFRRKVVAAAEFAYPSSAAGILPAKAGSHTIGYSWSFSNRLALGTVY
jgi:hypothetical protein